MDIRRRARGGERFGAIGADYCLDYQGVYHIVIGKTWKHLPLLGYERRSPQQFPKGSEHRGAKLDEADVMAIRARHAAGETVAAITRDYPVSSTAVVNIITRKKWKHVTQEKLHAQGSQRRDTGT